MDHDDPISPDRIGIAHCLGYTIAIIRIVREPAQVLANFTYRDVVGQDYGVGGPRGKLPEQSPDEWLAPDGDELFGDRPGPPGRFSPRCDNQ